MKRTLFDYNTSSRFWRSLNYISNEQWQKATKSASTIFDEDGIYGKNLLENILGEAQFGINHWRLSYSKRTYYLIKPLLPRVFTRKLRQLYSNKLLKKNPPLLNWPIEDRYIRFQWNTLKEVLRLSNNDSISFIHFWPEGKKFAFVLTHDIETAKGQSFVLEVANLERQYGFRSSFNFVPERYDLDMNLISELRIEGFEIGIHGLKHDGKLFNSFRQFERRSTRINTYLRKLEAVGFRSPLTLRHPQWMQLLDIEYDSSFFDTDPFEPISGGTMSIWPFRMGNFIELPYTLPQDYTLTSVLNEATPAMWLNKVSFIENFYGMVLLNTHPDYLCDQTNWEIYKEFLRTMSNINTYWHALARDVAYWWRNRIDVKDIKDLSGAVIASARLDGDDLVIGF